MTTDLQHINKVSVHGGHSGQFCHHASDPLEDIIRAYIAEGFAWVGITEHMAPLSDALRYPDEQADGLTADFLLQRFRDYFCECRQLADKYRNDIEILTAFETETYAGSAAFVHQLVNELKPDYLVGSVHHVNDICIDYDEAHFQQAVASTGGVEALYCAYFDAQYAMLEVLKPAVVGHFDLIRKFDPDYMDTLHLPEVETRVARNLAFIADHDLILDFNLRGFDKATEQYPSMPVLAEAIAQNIAIVPGDDSHGVSSVGRNYARGVKILQSLGVDTRWRKPQLIHYS
jgi:histidinol-phosphatase (PHP family)